MKTLYLTKFRPYIIIFFVVFVSTFILWLPFILGFHSINGIPTPGINFDTVIRHWDGPLYIIPAKTLYNVHSALFQEHVLGLSEKYFAAHLPGYPLTLRLLQPFVGYPRATVLSTLLASIALFWIFYFINRRLKLTTKPLLLTLVFMFITPRFFVVRSIGAPEPLFMLTILASIYFFVRKNYFLAGLSGALAIITKTPAGLLFIAYLLFFLIEHLRREKIPRQALYILLVPAGLLGVFSLYYYQYGDFFAYFHSGDNLHLTFPPYHTFNATQKWVGTAWLEDILYVYFLYGYTLMELLNRLGLYVYRSKNHLSVFIDKVKKKLHVPFGLQGFTDEQHRFYAVSACFALYFFLAVISISHRDVSRYALPLLPFMLITFEKFFTSRKFITLLIILIPAIYMYSWNFILDNVMPNINWAPFL